VPNNPRGEAIFPDRGLSLPACVKEVLMKEKVDRLLSFCRKYGRMIRPPLRWLGTKLLRDVKDREFWSKVLAMVGAACAAVGMVHFNLIDILSGVIASIIGLALDRQGRRK
jgi:hypothetical protein